MDSFTRETWAGHGAQGEPRMDTCARIDCAHTFVPRYNKKYCSAICRSAAHKEFHALPKPIRWQTIHTRLLEFIQVANPPRGFNPIKSAGQRALFICIKNRTHDVIWPWSTARRCRELRAEGFLRRAGPLDGKIVCYKITDEGRRKLAEIVP